MCGADPKVSVIVPVYNGQKTIARCIDSIINQTFKDWELIIVNDGSTDGTIDILRKYETDERLLLITQENSGVSVARNVGIKNATGEWITFVDADDYLERDCLEMVFINRNINEYDLIFWNYYRIMPNKKEKLIIFDDFQGVYSVTEILPYLFYNDGKQCLSSVYCRLFRRNVILQNQLCFQESVVMYEDKIFMFDYLMCIEKCLGFKKHLYNRTLNSASVMHCWHQNAKEEYLSVVSILKDRLLHNEVWDICQKAFHIWVLQESITQYLETHVCHEQNLLSMRSRAKELNEFISNKIISQSLRKIKYSSLPMKSRIKLFAIKHRYIFMLDKWYRNKNYFT